VRKAKVVTIEAEGRDKGKSFLVTEMSAMAAEKWAVKAVLALGRAGAEVPDEALEAGMLGILAAGLAAFRKMAFADAEPLLDEMMSCVAFCPDPNRKDALTQQPVTRPITWGDTTQDGDIEEVATLLTLRGEALEIHMGFSMAAALSNLAAAVQNSSPPVTRTSRRSSGQSSPRAKRPSPSSKASTA
jgi:hypothetical protein